MPEPKTGPSSAHPQVEAEHKDKEPQHPLPQLDKVPRWNPERQHDP